MVKSMVKLEEFLTIVGEVFPRQAVDKGEEQYDKCLGHREIWDNLESVNSDQVKDVVVSFLNKWQCRLPYDCVPGLTVALHKTEPLLKPLKGINIEDVDLLKPIKVDNEEIRMLTLVEKIFSIIRKVRAGRRTVGFTTTAKILHMAIPELFVMCDESIRKAYGCEGNAAGYANFMLKMSFFAGDLVSQAHGNKQRILDCSKPRIRTLARLLDNYNYTKFTLDKA